MHGQGGVGLQKGIGIKISSIYRRHGSHLRHGSRRRVNHERSAVVRLHDGAQARVVTLEGLAASGAEGIDDLHGIRGGDAARTPTPTAATTPTVCRALGALELIGQETPGVTHLMHHQGAAIEGFVDELGGTGKTEGLGEIARLITVEVPGAGVLARVEMAGPRFQRFHPRGEEDHGERHQAGGGGVNARGGDAHGSERSLLRGGECGLPRWGGLVLWLLLLRLLRGLLLGDRARRRRATVSGATRLPSGVSHER